METSETSVHENSFRATKSRKKWTDEKESKSQRDTGIDEVRRKFGEFIEWKDYRVIDIVLGSVVANCEEADSVFLFVIGPPSTGKTELLESLKGHPKIHPLSTLTPKALLSGLKEQGRKKKKGEPDKSLLLRLEKEGKRMIVMKDFTSVLKLRSEEQAEIFGQFREIADGSLRKAFGTGEEVIWEGNLAIIAGVTSAIDKSYATRQTLGERFLHVRIDAADAQAMAKKSMDLTGKEKQMRKELLAAVGKFFEQLQGVETRPVNIGEEIKRKLGDLACFVAKGRTGVERDRSSKVIICLPEPEGPARLARQFVHLGQGIATVLGKAEVDEEVYDMLRKVGRDSLPAIRNLLLETLWTEKVSGENRKTTRELSTLLQHPISTVYVWLGDLEEVGLVEGKFEEGGSGQRWRLSDECCGLIRRAEIYESKAD
jgi:DNA-binding transcriptional ArsR family regulator